MDHPPQLRSASLAALGATILLSGLAGCGGGDAAAPPDESGSVAERLHQAQMVEYGDAKLLTEQSETGAYGELVAVKQMDELREVTELDKPQCMDAVNQWGRLPEVREAPTSLATFGSEAETITHMLVQVPEEVAKKAISTTPPEECDSYTASVEDGTAATYTVRDLDLETVGDESRAFVVETELEGKKVMLYSMLYRSGDYLATTSLLSSEEGEERLAGFSAAALKREGKVLG
ncbi:hypothetical protein [Nocardiopsis ansamitocini]|uniref:Uncharacterized protein n=1 Tax=Nocardiopsis ansamitocini TaxID=1670832 RepID=A0A9W6PA15_9ACTN|nr:hypothetical protein [Nocardiopsis ansamitocini]GLU49767.1 hypothetical protein Nans01_41180 [Nocardiopsis ansamitocini]